MPDMQGHFRWKLLEGRPEDFGLDASAGVWGVLFEFGLRGGGGSVTLAALADGNASLYFSEGGAMIGGAARESIRKAAIALVRTAEGHIPALRKVTQCPKPWPGRVKFYALTCEAVLSADVDERELEEGRHPLAELFDAGHDVITQFRLLDEGSNPTDANDGPVL